MKRIAAGFLSGILLVLCLGAATPKLKGLPEVINYIYQLDARVTALENSAASQVTGPRDPEPPSIVKPDNPTIDQMRAILAEISKTISFPGDPYNMPEEQVKSLYEHYDIIGVI